MKKSKIHISILGIVVSLFLVFELVSCKKGDDGFPYDSSYDGLFRPIIFSTYSIDANSVGVQFTNVISAKKYIIEVSEDSLVFSNIVRRITINADTLTPFATSSDLSMVLYHVFVDSLNASQRHSVRIMAVNSDSSLTSKYKTYTFKTLSENILAPLSINMPSVTFKWKKTDKLDYLVLYNSTSRDSIKLTDQEKADTTKTLSDLIMGSVYTAKLYYLEGTTARVRGYKTFKTAGISYGNNITLLPSDNINTVLANAFTAGQTDVALLLNPGDTYNLGTVNIPSGMNTFMLSCVSNTNMPVVNLTKVIPASDMTSGIYFENTKITGPGSSSSSNILMDLGTNMNIGYIGFQGCSVSAYNGLLRLKSTATISLSTVLIDNCIVSDIGGTGMLNIAGTAPTNQLGIVSFQNSTFINLSTQVADIRCKATYCFISSCSFYNNSTTNKLSYLFRFTDSNSTPTNLGISSNVFAGSNGGTNLASFYANYTPLTSYSFSSSYKTAELSTSTATGQSFTKLNALGINSTDLFIDPVNGNFKVKSTISTTDFVDKGRVGDPRWFW
ncbi:MAG TPA: DUF5123 domain-containing protein [Bacteroidales bacterium]